MIGMVCVFVCICLCISVVLGRKRQIKRTDILNLLLAIELSGSCVKLGPQEV